MIHNDFSECFTPGSPFHIGETGDGRKNVSVKEDFHCPHCGGVLSIDDIVGKTVRCQYCDSVLPVPSWMEGSIETVIIFADNRPFITETVLLDKGVLTPNEIRESAFIEAPQMSFHGRFNELAYNCGTDSASFAERFNTIGRKYGVEQLAPNLYLMDEDTSIEETAERVIIRKKLSFEKMKTTRNAVLKTILLILFYGAVCSPLIYALLR